MAESTDQELLDRYARTGADGAFAELVSRRVNLVFSVALRYTGDTHQAEEVTQAVFIILARKAGCISPKVVLTGWLYQATRFVSLRLRKENRRRQQREHNAFLESTMNTLENGETWERIAPVLDEAMNALRIPERDALLLRYFENRSLAEVGVALGVSESAAEKRVSRALEKLRKIFNKRGATLTAALIAGAVSANSVQAAPVGMAKTVSVIALTKGAAAGGLTLTLVNGALKIMAWTKMKTALLVAGGVMALTATAVVWSQEDYLRNLHFSGEYAAKLAKAPPMFSIEETHFPDKPLVFTNDIGGAVVGYNRVGRNQTLDVMIRHAYMTNPWRSLFAVFPPDLGMPTNHYDWVVSGGSDSLKRFQKEIQNRFGYVGHMEVIRTNCYVLRLATVKPKLRPSNGKGKNSAWGISQIANSSMDHLCQVIETYFALKTPVVDQTGLTGIYDLRLDWKWEGGMASSPSDPLFAENLKSFRAALRRQIGLDLLPTNMPVEMLVVERAR